MSENEELKQHDEEPSPWWFFKIGFGLILAFLLFCALGYIVGYTKLAHNIDDDARLFIKDIFFAIGTACAVSFIFGLLLEMPETSRHLAAKLSDLMFGDEYLRAIQSSLPLLRRRIDRVLFGAEEVASHQSLYNFVEGRLQTLYRASFRRNMYVEVRCTEESSDTFLWHQETSYTYVRNPKDPQPSRIPSRRTLDVSDTLAPATKQEAKDAFNDIVTRLYLRIGEHEYQSGPDDRTTLTRVENKDIAIAKMPETIEVKYEFKLRKLNYSYECDLPMEMFVGPNEVFVEVHDDHRTLRVPGNLIYAGVAAPTEDFTMYCVCPEGTRLEPARFFWQGIQKMSDLGTEFDAVSVKIPGWLLQGEGGCVAWFVPAKPTADAAAPATGELRATPPDVSET